MTYQAKVISGGKVVIPAEFRHDLDIKDGDSIVFERDDAGTILLKTHGQIVAEVRKAFRDLRGPDDGRESMVDALRAERRESARREAESFDRWVADHP